VTASRPAVLVASETFWPDWHATVNGGTQPIVRANGIFRAIPVGAGVHDVRMFIRPRMLYAGEAISFLGLLLAGCCLFGARALRPLKQRHRRFSATAAG
jgi:uncharacterized membrane protein YfhO